MTLDNLMSLYVGALCYLVDSIMRYLILLLGVPPSGSGCREYTVLCSIPNAVDVMCVSWWKAEEEGGYSLMANLK